MQVVSDASSAPPLDGSGLSGGFALSLGSGFGALAGSAALVASASSLGRALELVLVFVVLTTLEVVAYAHALRPWLHTGHAPRRGQLLQVLVVLLALLAFTGGPTMGLIGLCALAAGAFLPNASTIRTHRVALSFTEPDDERGADGSETSAHASTTDPPAARARPAPQVGPALRTSVATSLDRWLAWGAATLTVTVSGLAVSAPGEVLLLLDFVGVTALAWATLRLLAARVALREFEEAAAEPHVGYIVLVRDSRAPAMRPMLGVWAKEPVPTEAGLPRAQAVYRCDRRAASLVSTKGALTVHRAWLDTGPHPGARPRWVAADAGIALPQRRSLLGSWYFDTVLGSERGSRARALKRPAPDPTTEAETGTFVTVISEPTRQIGRFFRLFVQRLVGLSLAGLLLGWWGSDG